MSKSQLTNWRLKICQAPFPIFAPWRRKAHTFPWISGMKLEYSLFITCEVRQIGTLAPIYLWLPYPCSLVQNSFKRRKNASFQVENSKNFRGRHCPPLHPPRSRPARSSGLGKKNDYLERGGNDWKTEYIPLNNPFSSLVSVYKLFYLFSCLSSNNSNVNILFRALFRVARFSTSFTKIAISQSFFEIETPSAAHIKAKTSIFLLIPKNFHIIWTPADWEASKYERWLKKKFLSIQFSL